MTDEGRRLPHPIPTNYLANLPTKSIEQMPSWKANNSSPSQETPRNLRKPTVRNRVHNSPPIVLNAEPN
jgi:hypothetical protein